MVPEEAGPAAEEPAFKLWLYRSSVDITAHDSAGLLGGVLVGRPAAVQQFSASADLTPLSTAEADRDMILVTTVSQSQSRGGGGGKWGAVHGRGHGRAG